MLQFGTSLDYNENSKEIMTYRAGLSDIVYASIIYIQKNKKYFFTDLARSLIALVTTKLFFTKK